MGKSNKKANAEVALSVPTAASKKGKKGKRELDAELVGQLPLKKSKLSNKVPPKKKPETSSSEDSDSQSEEEDRRCIMELWKFLLHKSLKEANTVKLKAFWENNPHDVGLLVSERVVNLPIELVPPLYDALFDEVSWATEDEPTQALRESFQFKHYLLITKVYQTLQDIQGKCKETKIEIKRRKKGSSQNGDGKEQYNGQLIYIKPEDEIFHQLSSWSFTFPVHAEYQAAHEFENLKTMQLVMAVKAEKIQTFRTQLKALVDESQVVE
ncbi:protein BCCIP homolog isoform X2 [Cryptomeria japonica]|uniref:protein BCCIP homolog isoform X2 n=1 Tax=Cryptomeria japonica TaxID=3369 RepID=UPI0027DA055B|nr:protein BCCIP homolog isoform X2 [Cryptomeria japonica]